MWQVLSWSKTQLGATASCVGLFEISEYGNIIHLYTLPHTAVNRGLVFGIWDTFTLTKVNKAYCWVKSKLCVFHYFSWFLTTDSKHLFVIMLAQARGYMVNDISSWHKWIYRELYYRLRSKDLGRTHEASPDKLGTFWGNWLSSRMRTVNVCIGCRSMTSTILLQTHSFLVGIAKRVHPVSRALPWYFQSSSPNCSKTVWMYQS